MPEGYAIRVDDIARILGVGLDNTHLALLVVHSLMLVPVDTARRCSVVEGLIAVIYIKSKPARPHTLSYLLNRSKERGRYISVGSPREVTIVELDRDRTPTVLSTTKVSTTLRIVVMCKPPALHRIDEILDGARWESITLDVVTSEIVLIKLDDEVVRRSVLHPRWSADALY